MHKTYRDNQVAISVKSSGSETGIFVEENSYVNVCPDYARGISGIGVGIILDIAHSMERAKTS